ncbi:hypothetical protein [Paenibacillus marinisediminis]
MSKFKKPISIIAGILIISIIGILLYHSNHAQTTFSFNDLLREHIKEKEIESIFIQKFMSADSKDYSDIRFTDKKDIEFVIKSLPEIQVRSDASLHGFPEYPNYQLNFIGKNGKLFLAFIVSSEEILLHDNETKDNYSYKITNEFSLDKLEFYCSMNLIGIALSNNKLNTFESCLNINWNFLLIPCV